MGGTARVCTCESFPRASKHGFSGTPILAESAYCHEVQGIHVQTTVGTEYEDGRSHLIHLPENSFNQPVSFGVTVKGVNGFIDQLGEEGGKFVFIERWLLLHFKPFVCIITFEDRLHIFENTFYCSSSFQDGSRTHQNHHPLRSQGHHTLPAGNLRPTQASSLWSFTSLSLLRYFDHLRLTD